MFLSLYVTGLRLDRLAGYPHTEDMAGQTNEPGSCTFCAKALPVPRNTRRLYCDRCLRKPPTRRPTRTNHVVVDTEITLLIAERRNAPCMDCHQRFPSVCMDFDHRDPATKHFAISKAKSKTLGEVLSELAKCDLVCSNCHRIRTWITRKQDT